MIRVACFSNDGFIMPGIILIVHICTAAFMKIAVCTLRVDFTPAGPIALKSLCRYPAYHPASSSLVATARTFSNAVSIQFFILISRSAVLSFTSFSSSTVLSFHFSTPNVSVSLCTCSGLNRASVLPSNARLYSTRSQKNVNIFYRFPACTKK